jgi:hypothetical protein
VACLVESEAVRERPALEIGHGNLEAELGYLCTGHTGARRQGLLPKPRREFAGLRALAHGRDGPRVARGMLEPAFRLSCLSGRKTRVCSLPIP